MDVKGEQQLDTVFIPSLSPILDTKFTSNGLLFVLSPEEVSRKVISAAVWDDFLMTCFSIFPLLEPVFKHTTSSVEGSKKRVSGIFNSRRYLGS